jgi:hypothetical protein
LVNELANIDISSYDAPSETTSPKYMNHLVRVFCVFSVHLTMYLTYCCSNEYPTVINRCWSLTWKIFTRYASYYAYSLFLTRHQHENTISELVTRIRHNTRRYVSLFSEVVDKLLPEPTKDISEHDEVIDVILHQRRERNEQLEGGGAGFPDHLLRR